MIDIFYSGAESYNKPQTQPNKSIGGFMSSTKILNNKNHTLFQQETYRILSDKKSEYICLILKFPAGDVEDVLIGIEKLNANTNYSIALGFSELSESFEVEKIQDMYTEPYGVTFQPETYASDDDDTANMFDIGSRTTTKTIALWLRRDLNKDIAEPAELCELDPETSPVQTLDGFKILMRYNSATFCEPGFQNGREVCYLSLINEINIGGKSTPFLAVTLSDAEFIDLENVVPQTPEYEIQWGDATTDPIIVSGTEIHDVSGLANGGYVGKIIETNSLAECEFWYTVINGAVESLIVKRKTSISVTLTCGLYPSYPLTMNDECEVDGSDFTESSMELFNNTIQNSNYTNQTAYNNSAMTTSNFAAPEDEILAVNSVAGYDSGTLQNKGVLRTRGVA